MIWTCHVMNFRKEAAKKEVEKVTGEKPITQKMFNAI